VQFHPEKPGSSFHIEGVVHTAAMIQMNRIFSDFFVSEAKKNKNSFKGGRKEENSLMI